MAFRVAALVEHKPDDDADVQKILSDIESRGSIDVFLHKRVKKNLKSALGEDGEEKMKDAVGKVDRFSPGSFNQNYATVLPNVTLYREKLLSPRVMKKQT